MKLSQRLREVIAAEVYDAPGAWSHPTQGDIKRVEFRTGCSEIEVTFIDPVDEREEQVTINAAPVLTVLVQGLIEEQE